MIQIKSVQTLDPDYFLSFSSSSLRKKSMELKKQKNKFLIFLLQKKFIQLTYFCHNLHSLFPPHPPFTMSENPPMSRSLLTIFHLELPLILKACENDDIKGNTNQVSGNIYQYTESPSDICCLYEYHNCKKNAMVFRILSLINEYQNTGWRFGRYHRPSGKKGPIYNNDYNSVRKTSGIIITIPILQGDNFRTKIQGPKPSSGSNPNPNPESVSMDTDNCADGDETPEFTESQISLSHFPVHTPNMVFTIFGYILKDILYRWRPMDDEEMSLLPHYSDNHEGHLFFIYQYLVTPNFLETLRTISEYFGYERKDLLFDYHWYVNEGKVVLMRNRPYFIIRKVKVDKIYKKIPFKCLEDFVKKEEGSR